MEEGLTRAGFLAGAAATTLYAGSGWRPFHGIPVSFGTLRVPLGAILVDVAIGTEIVAFQLDTGAASSVLDPKTAALINRSRRRVLTVAGIDLPLEKADINADITSSSLGLNLFREHLLSIDLGRNRLAIDLPGSALTGVDWCDARMHDGAFFIPVMVDGRDDPDFMLDTGSAPLAFVLRRAVFERFTRKRASDDLPQIAVPAWGKKIRLGFAPTVVPLAVGRHSLPRSKAYVTLDAGSGTDIDSLRYPISGIIGLAAFEGSELHIDCENRRFGIRTPIRP